MQKTIIMNKFMIVAAAIIMGMGVVFFTLQNISAQTESPKPFAGIVIDPETVVIPIDLVAAVMEIHQGDKPYLVVAEKIIWVTEYDFSGEIFSTQVMNKNGRPITLSDLKIDQMVIITGIELADKTILAEQIQIESQ